MSASLGVCKTVTWYNQSHEANDFLSLNHLSSHNNLLSYNHLRRLDTEMDMQEWSSRLKKKFKPGSKKYKPDRPGAESGADSASSLVRPLPHVVTGSGHNQEEDGTSSSVEQVLSTDRLSPLDVEQVAGHGGDNDREGEGGGIDREEVSQKHSREVATGSGPSQEGNGADDESVEQGHPSTSTPLIPRSGRPDGSTCARLF